MATFAKDVIRPGRYWVPSIAGWLDVTADRMRRWVDTFGQMRSRGVGADLTVDHADPKSAWAKIGSIAALSLHGDKLVASVEVPDDDAEALKLVKRCPEVSLELSRNFKDGHGNAYDEALTAVTVCRKPVVPGQGAFEQIAASRATVLASAGITAGTTLYFSAEPIPTTEKTPSGKSRSNAMTPEQIAEIRKLLNIPESVPDEEIGTAIITALAGKGDKPVEDSDAAEAMGEPVGSVAAMSLTAKIRKLVGVAKTLKSEKANNAPYKADPDTLEEAADNLTTKLSLLAEKGKLTPAALEVAKAKLVGTASARPVICLSRTAATKAGLEARVADTVIAILEANEPAELAKMLGEKSKSQRVTLSRETPGGNDNPVALPADAIKEMAEGASGISTPGASSGYAI